MTIDDGSHPPADPPTGGVLVATDFSDGARLAEQRAAQLAREHGVPLILLHVLPNDWMAALQEWLGAARPSDRIVADAQATLQATARRLQDEQGWPVHPVFAQGHPVHAIGETALRCAARWVVVGAHGRGRLQRLLLGTTAERLLRKATYPLLVVRQPVQHGYRCALVPVDFSPWSAPALALADALAPHAAVEMLHAYTVPFEEKLRFAGVDDDMIALYREKTRERAAARLHELARQRGWPPSRYHVTLHEGDAAPGIVQQAARRACDLIVIGKHGLSAAEELLFGSVTEHVLSEAPCDVLVSPGRASG